MPVILCDQGTLCGVLSGADANLGSAPHYGLNGDGG